MLMYIQLTYSVYLNVWKLVSLVVYNIRPVINDSAALVTEIVRLLSNNILSKPNSNFDPWDVINACFNIFFSSVLSIQGELETTGVAACFN